MSIQVNIIYTPLYRTKASYEVDSSQGFTVEDGTRLVLLKQVSSITPLVGSAEECQGTFNALHRALVNLKSHGCTSARYYNVEDSERDCLHIEVADADGRLPWTYVIANGVLVSVADGKVVRDPTVVDLTDLDMSEAPAVD